MKPDVYKVLLAQFLTAFADNAILFAAITMLLHTHQPEWYVPALQGSFLIAFVVLAPWVGRYADRVAKSVVMTRANLIKAAGAVLMAAHVEPLLAYAVVGLGAAFYGPAKYGILPEIVSEDQLVKANGWIEGSTILAIITGMLAGAALAEKSVSAAMFLVVALYLISALTTRYVTRSVSAIAPHDGALRDFTHKTRVLLTAPRARFVTMGVSLFWGTAAVLREVLIAFAPVVFLVTQSTDIAKLSLFIALGIAVGALGASRLIPLTHLRRSRLAAYGMGLAVLALAWVDQLWLGRTMLFVAGVMGGLFVVPINAALQEIGHKRIGAGSAVAVQQFFENLAMLIGSGLYAAAAHAGAPPVATMATLGGIILVATVAVSYHLPPDSAHVEEELPKQEGPQ